MAYKIKKTAKEKKEKYRLKILKDKIKKNTLRWEEEAEYRRLSKKERKKKGLKF
jgi:hypothetical protein